MKEIALHLLDIVQNSITAEASHVRIRFELDAVGMLTMTVEDDGRGMNEEFVQRVQSPCVTTRSTRRVGLGIPLLMQNAALSGGSVSIKSALGKGTVITARFNTQSIDCLPLGDLSSTLATIIMGNPDKPEFSLICSAPAGEMSFSTEEIRPVLEGVSLSEPSVVQWIQESLNEEIKPILGGIFQ